MVSEYPYVRLEDIGRYVGQKVLIKGWLRKMRSSGKILFLADGRFTGDGVSFSV